MSYKVNVKKKKRFSQSCFSMCGAKQNSKADGKNAIIAFLLQFLKNVQIPFFFFHNIWTEISEWAVRNSPKRKSFETDTSLHLNCLNYPDYSRRQMVTYRFLCKLLLIGKVFPSNKFRMILKQKKKTRYLSSVVLSTIHWPILWHQKNEKLQSYKGRWVRVTLIKGKIGKKKNLTVENLNNNRHFFWFLFSIQLNLFKKKAKNIWIENEKRKHKKFLFNCSL